MTRRLIEISSVPSGATILIGDFKSALKYASVIDDPTRKLSAAGDDLLPLANFTSVGTKADFDSEIQKDFDFFMYFGHGLGDCIFDESGYCTIYPDNNLKDKIIVLTACNCGRGYAKTAVREYGSIASLGYGAPLAAELSGDGFSEGFKECFLNLQKSLLALSEVTENDFVSAYESTKALYKSWGDYYADTNPIRAHLFYADGNNLLSYSMWDVMTTIDILVSPTPCEVYKDDVFIGMTPITDYSVMSGGNVFQCKAIGCYLWWIVKNVPKSGASYSVTPSATRHINVREYTNVYLEHPDFIDIHPDKTPDPFKMSFFNYGDTSLEASVSNDRNWDVRWMFGNDLKTHLMSGNICNLYIDEVFEPPTGVNPRVEYVNITVNVGDDATDTFSIPIWIYPEQPEHYGAAYVSRTVSPFSSQYNNMSTTEKNTRNIMIGTKVYTPAEIMEEIDKGTEIGVMLLEAMK